MPGRRGIRYHVATHKRYVPKLTYVCVGRATKKALRPANPLQVFAVARPQSMMFTLFGDYIMHRGGEVWVGTLIKIAAEFGLSQQAVRSALSRMSQKGWLKVRHVGN